MFSSAQGKFRVLECHPAVTPAPQDEDLPAPVELRFQHLGPGGETTGTLAVDAETYSAITEDQLTPRFWDGHLLTVLLPEERGGLWLIGNWTGSEFVFTKYPYATGDEDGIDIAWKDGAFLVTTVPEGERRVLAGQSGSGPGEFANESVACSTKVNGVEHALRLGRDTKGSVIELEYSSAIPAGDGGNHLCLIQASRGDGSSEWTPAADGELTIDIASQDDSVPGSQLRIRADETRKTYTVALDVVPSAFCGQSDAIAREVVLKTDTPHCASLYMPTNETGD